MSSTANVYIHIPFCSKRCSYCNFATLLSCDVGIHDSYAQSLISEIKSKKFLLNKSLKSIYFGGGSPSLINPNLIGNIIEIFSNYISDTTELLLEINPQDISLKNLEVWKSVGITRVSIGIQSFQNKFSNFLDRKIESSFLIDKIQLAKKHFKISIDLIFGIPGQTLSDIESDLALIKVLKPDHLSYYALDYKDKTKIASNKQEALRFDIVVGYYNLICNQLSGFGYNQYEIYNFSNKANICVHNKDFWTGNDYIGFGLSAVSMIGKTVNKNVLNINKYLSGTYSAKEEHLSEFEYNHLMFQRLMRLSSGVSSKQIRDLFGVDILKSVIKSEFTEQYGNLIKLNQKGKMYFNDFFEEIFS